MGKKTVLFFFGAALAVIAFGMGNKEVGPASGNPLEGSLGGKIRVSCYDSLGYRNFLEEAAKLFMEKYPGTEAEVQTFSAMPEVRSSGEGDTRMVLVVQTEDDPRSRNDYINRVNTALMSGEGADIYAADILPFHKYAESGQFEHLATYMSGDPAWAGVDFRANILEAAKFHGGLWFMPLDYGFDYYAYDTVLLPERTIFGPESAFTTEALMDMAKPLFDGGEKIFDAFDYVPGSSPGPGDMFDQLLFEYYPSLVDLENKKANFNDGTFVKILELVKEYAGAGYIPRSTAGEANPGEMRRRAQGQETDRYFFKLHNNFSLVSQAGRGSGRRFTIRAAGNSGGVEDDDEIAGIRANRDGGIPFRFSHAFGINRNSKNKRTAWEFLKFLLSDEIQASTALSPSALPVNNRARTEKAALLLSGGFMGREAPPDERQEDAVRRYRAAVEGLSDQINRYVLEDTVINDMIAAEAAHFFRGAKTAEETAAVLQNRVNLYLHE
ncbi:MAG: extracellular solute-binding protein [Spirochaetaceae bacterium]|nr:extracellular solute-binding protein [Spirochaetaceae bacterium]